MESEKIKKGSVLMKALKEDIAPTLQCIRETLGNNSLVHDAALWQCGSCNESISSVSKDDNPIERKNPQQVLMNKELKKKKDEKRENCPALKRMSRERIKGGKIQRAV